MITVVWHALAAAGAILFLHLWEMYWSTVVLL